MNISEEILILFKKLEASVQCPICNDNPTSPVRIKTCGHYFCTDCLKSSKQDHNCPKCNEYYLIQHLDYKPLSTSTENELTELRQLLEPALKPEENNCIINYKNNKYHVNYLTTTSKINSKGETPLHLACKRNKFNEVKNLIESKVDVNAKDFAGWVPLHEAIQSESLQIIEYLLKNNCLVNIPGADYTTPLHQAVELENLQIVRILLEYGADKNSLDYNGLKPEECTKNQNIKDVIQNFDNIVNNRLFEVFLPKDIHIYCHSIDNEYKKVLNESNNIRVADKLDMTRKLTHFAIKKTHKMSFKILQAMLEGLQFLTEDSVKDYVKGDYFINIPEYIFLENDRDLNKGIQQAMISSLLKLPKLFDGIYFYIEDHSKPVEVYHLKVQKEYLTKLIKAGGGKILQRPPATRTCESEFLHPFFSSMESGTFRCCNFILYEENNPPELLYKMNELQHKTSKWLIDCIVKYEISD